MSSFSATLILLTFASADPAMARSSASKAEKTAAALTEQILANAGSAGATVAVLSFQSPDGSNSDLGVLLAEAVTDNIAKSSRLTVLDRQNLCATLAEMKLGATGLTDQAAALQFGRMKSAKYLVTGAIKPVGKNDLVISARLLETETGHIASTARSLLPYSKDFKAMLESPARSDSCPDEKAPPEKKAEPPALAVVQEEPEYAAPIPLPASKDRPQRITGNVEAPIGPWIKQGAFEGKSVEAFAKYKGELYAAISGDAGQAAVYKLEGDTWSQVLETDLNEMNALQVFDGKLYAGAGTGWDGARRATVFEFDGKTWKRLAVLPEHHNAKAFAVYKGRLYLATNLDSGQIYVLNGSSQFERVYKSPGTEIRAMSVHNGKLYLGVNGSPPFRAMVVEFDGRTWTPTTSFPGACIYSLGIFQGKVYAGTGVPGAEVYVQKGAEWTLSGSIAPEGTIYDLVPIGGVLLAVGSIEYQGVIYKLSEFGWLPDLNSPTSAIRSVTEFKGTIFAGGGIRESGQVAIFKRLPGT